MNGGNGQRSWRRTLSKCLLIVSDSSPFDDGAAVVVVFVVFFVETWENCTVHTCGFVTGVH